MSTFTLMIINADEDLLRVQIPAEILAGIISHAHETAQGVTEDKPDDELNREILRQTAAMGLFIAFPYGNKHLSGYINRPKCVTCNRMLDQEERDNPDPNGQCTYCAKNRPKTLKGRVVQFWREHLDAYVDTNDVVRPQIMVTDAALEFGFTRDGLTPEPPPMFANWAQEILAALESTQHPKDTDSNPTPGAWDVPEPDFGGIPIFGAGTSPADGNSNIPDYPPDKTGAVWS